jgi:hypothetical protein
MEELNELKNLVIQTLEANGQLSNIRAQIRSSVFKIVDEPNNEKKVFLSNLGIPIPLGKCKMLKTIRKRERKRTLEFDKRIFPILQHGLH